MKRTQLLSALGILAIVLIGIFTSWSFFKAQAMCKESTNEALCVSDKAVVNNDVKICNTASTDLAKEGCALRAVPALAKDEAVCNSFTFEKGKNICLEYVKKITLAKNKQTPASYRYFDYAQKKVVVTFADGSKKEFDTNIADTDDKKIQGLSFRQSLKDNEAMLFTYEQPRLVRYHMKDMLFSIDIIYTDKDGKVLNAFRSLPSCVVYTGECAVYGSSSSDVVNVLEILPQGKDAVKIEIK
ncbi:MAG: DUF192 domain-containing protein [Candidatus Gracilibacteria bacterium]